MKRLACFLMSVVLILGLMATACAEAPDMSVLSGLTVGFSQCDNGNSWRVAETNSMKEVAAKYGINCIITDAGGDIAKQASDIQDLIAQGVSYLVVAPQQEDGLQASIADAMDKNIPVILIDRTINGEAGTDYTAEIMSDFVWEAQQVAKVILDKTGGEGNIVVIEGTQGATSTIDRQTGFMDAIKGSNLKVVVDQVGDYTLAGGQAVMESVLQAWGDKIAAVYCHNDDMALGAVAAIKQAGFDPAKFNVCGIDSPKTALEAVKSGEMLASCSCSPLFGEATYALIAKIKAGLKYDLKNQNSDTLSTKDNVDVSKGF
jgi:ABC-type sugar transport system substrate-binding protein